MRTSSSRLVADVSTGFWALYGAAYGPSNILSGDIGDGNSEVVVDSPDFNLFKLAFGSESDIPLGPPDYNVSMDFNLDGFVDALLRIDAWFRQQIASEVLTDKLIVGDIAVEGADQIIAIHP